MHVANDLGLTLNTTSPNQSFPRTVFDEDGNYTVDGYSHFLVSSPSIQRYAEITYARRDLESALEMINACADELGTQKDSLIKQSLWISSVVMYSKPFKRSNARKLFDVKTFIEGKLDVDGLAWHEYILNLRDKMIAHDDGLGESKILGLFLRGQPPKEADEVGISGGKKRITSMGTNIARDLTPHFGYVKGLLADYESKERVRTIQQLVQAKFNDVTLLGVYEDDALDISQPGVLARYGKRQPATE